MISTRQVEIQMRQQNLARYGVEFFECHPDMFNGISKTETTRRFFGLLKTYREVKFYPRLIYWRVNGKTFSAKIDPKVFRIVGRGGEFWVENTAEMEAETIALIEESKSI